MGDSGQQRGAKPGDFEATAREYWNAWAGALRGASPDAAAAQPWQAAMDWWIRAAQGGAAAGTDDVLDRFNGQARQWFGQMQQLAARFGGGNASAADIASAWRQAVESAGGDAFVDLMRGMRGPGMQGFEQWLEQVRPWLDGMRGEGLSWLRTPTFGFAREHQQRWQQLALAMADYQQCTQAYDELMRRATQDAFEIFEDKLREHEAPGQQVQSARALFDLWVDAAEDAYAKIALSEAFRDAYGRLVDAQMRVRAGVQREVEQATALLGMPTRTELDGAHRKIVELERQLRRLRDELKASPPGSARRPETPRKPAKAAPAKKTASKRAATGRKPAVKKSPAKATTRTAKKSAKKTTKGKR